MFDVITVTVSGERHSNDFRHRFSGYATYADAERWADVILANADARVLCINIVAR